MDNQDRLYSNFEELEKGIRNHKDIDEWKKSHGKVIEKQLNLCQCIKYWACG